MPIEVEILDSQLQTLLQPQPGAMEQGRDKPHRPVEMSEDLVHFLPAEDDGHGAQRLILRRGTDAPLFRV